MNSQIRVTLSSSEREAGPPSPQSRLIETSSLPEAVRENLPGLKDKEATVLSLKMPVSETSIYIGVLSVLASVPQENLPALLPEAVHKSLEVAAVSQSTSPPPK